MPQAIRPLLVLVAAALLVMALAACGSAPRRAGPSAPPPAPPGPAVTAPGWHTASLEIAGVQRWYRVYVPERLAPGAPGVLLLHGGGQSMRRMLGPNAGGALEWPALAGNQGFVLLVPNGTNPNTGDTFGDRQSWNDLRPDGTPAKPRAEDVAFLTALMRWAAETYRLDDRRLYVTGNSNGGFMTYRLLLEAPETFAAGAAFIANLPASSPAYAAPVRPRPVMITLGTEDPLMPYQGGRVADGRGEVMPAAATADWWVARNRARAAQARTTRLPQAGPAGDCRIEITRTPAGPDGAPVVFVTMQGGGHSMPSVKHRLPSNILVRRTLGPDCAAAEGAVLAWDFLQAFRRP